MKPLQPNECETLIGEDGRQVKLVFRSDDGDSREIVVDRQWLPQLITQLQRRIAPGQAVPINKDSLDIGQTFALQGYQVRRNADGGAILTLFVDLPDQGRVVTIPLDFSSKDVDQLILMLKGESPSS
jgi:hypothetical protein